MKENRKDFMASLGYFTGSTVLFYGLLKLFQWVVGISESWGNIEHITLAIPMTLIAVALMVLFIVSLMSGVATIVNSFHLWDNNRP